MPRPPESGAYAVTRPTGEAFVCQYAGGRLVELLGPIQTSRRPGRTTTRYLAPSWGQALADAQRQRQQALEEAAAQVWAGRLLPRSGRDEVGD